jgi:hypothetical protein
MATPYAFPFIMSSNFFIAYSAATNTAALVIGGLITEQSGKDRPLWRVSILRVVIQFADFPLVLVVIDG